VYGLFRRWQRDGTWRKIVTLLLARADAAGLITWDAAWGKVWGQPEAYGCLGPARLCWLNECWPATIWVVVLL
jgi:hypothetical protein